MIYDVRQFGAAGDGWTRDTAAIQRAVDAAHDAGGGVVVLPPGVYVSGTIELRSCVTLELTPGATLLGSPDLANYPPDGPARGDRHGRQLLRARGARRVGIRGGGVIDGNGPAFWESHPSATPPGTWIRAKPHRVSPMIELDDCADVRIENVDIVNSPGWTVHLRQCDFVWVRGVRVDNALFGPNTDGFDVNGCRDVMISDCHVSCGDDAIVLKSTRDARACERVTVTNCVLRSNCVAFKCGTESWHGFRQIAFGNSIVHASHRAIGLYLLDGGAIEGVTISNVVCDTLCGLPLARPIHIDARKRPPLAGAYDARPLDEQPAGEIRDVRISDVTARTDGRVLLTAADGCRVRGVTLRGLSLTYPSIEDPEPLAAGARSAQFSNASPEARAARAAVVADGIEDLVIHDLQIRWPDDDGAVPPTHALWARRLRGGSVDTSGLAGAGGAAAVDVRESEIEVGR